MSDRQIRELKRRIQASPGDNEAVGQLMAALLRAEQYHISPLPELAAPEESIALQTTYCLVCESAVDAGASLADWHSRRNDTIPIIFREELELLCPDEGLHERLRLYVSYPGISSGAQVLAFTAANHAAGIVYINFPFNQNEPPTVGWTGDYYPMVTNFWLRELCKNESRDEIIQRAVDHVNIFRDYAQQMIGEGVAADMLVANSLRFVHDIRPSAIAAPAGDSVFSSEDQEAFCQWISPCVRAGVRLRQWIETFSSHNYYHSLSTGWERGVILDSPFARQHGAASAIPLCWDLIGGSIVKGSDGAPYKIHRGGTAAIAYCHPEGGGGFIVGPADELLPSNLRWTTAVSFRHEYDFDV